jgi:putative ABC transport system permease protein
MLVGDRAKFFGIVLGLSFAALLITQQGSIFCGLMLRTAAQITDITGADLWVMEPNVRYIDDVKPMIETSLHRVRGVEGVRWAVPLYKGNGRMKLSFSVWERRDASGELLAWRVVDSPSARLGPGQPSRASSGTLEVQSDSATPRSGAPSTSSKNAQPPRESEAIQHYDIIEQVILIGLEDASMIGSPPPERIFCGSLEDLRKPDAVMVDRAQLRKIFPHLRGKVPDPPTGPALITLKAIRQEEKRLGVEFNPSNLQAFSRRGIVVPTSEQLRDLAKLRELEKFLNFEIEMNDHRAVVVGICEATRTFQTNPVVYTTYSRTKQFIPRERKMLSYILAKAEPGVDSKAIGDRIFARTGLRAYSSDEFQWMTINYYLKYTGIPVNFGITVLLGFLVGTAIAGQTFYNFTIENLKQFGALKAMGATNLRIVGMILLQALVVGVLGFGLGVGGASWFGANTAGTELAFFTPWILLPITAGAVLLICMLSSLLSVRRVLVLEPAVVFRG